MKFKDRIKELVAPRKIKYLKPAGEFPESASRHWHQFPKSGYIPKTIRKIPKIYRDDFMSEGLILMKKRVLLTIGIFLSTFIGGTALGNLALYGMVKPQTFSTWGLAILLSSLIFVLNKKVSNLHLARVTAILYVMAIVILLARHYTVASAFPYLPVITYVILLFGVTFAIPWLPGDIIGLSLMHIGGYTLYFLNTQTYIYRDLTLSVSGQDYFHAIVIIVIASVICFIVNLRNNEARIETFILLKELEGKNKQMRDELELATRVHKRLVPHSVSTNLADVAVLYLPMYYMGGDYAKFHFIDKKKMLFIICDVTGHGVSAALLVNAFNTEFERLAKTAISPGVLLKEMDQFISEDFEGINMYLTAFCGLLDFGSRKFVYSSYGHPPQYIYRSSRSEIKSVTSQTSFLGLPIKDENIYQNEIPFYRGDQILLFTDGILEARNNKGEEYGDKRVEAFLIKNHKTPIEQFNKRLLAELKAFTANGFGDDVFLLSIKVK